MIRRYEKISRRKSRIVRPSPPSAPSPPSGRRGNGVSAPAPTPSLSMAEQSHEEMMLRKTGVATTESAKRFVEQEPERASRAIARHEVTGGKYPTMSDADALRRLQFDKAEAFRQTGITPTITTIKTARERLEFGIAPPLRPAPIDETIAIRKAIDIPTYIPERERFPIRETIIKTDFPPVPHEPPVKWRDIVAEKLKKLADVIEKPALWVEKEKYTVAEEDYGAEMKKLVRSWSKGTEQRTKALESELKKSTEALEADIGRRAEGIKKGEVTPETVGFVREGEFYVPSKELVTGFEEKQLRIAETYGFVKGAEGFVLKPDLAETFEKRQEEIAKKYEKTEKISKWVYLPATIPATVLSAFPATVTRMGAYWLQYTGMPRSQTKKVLSETKKIFKEDIKAQAKAIKAEPIYTGVELAGTIALSYGLARGVGLGAKAVGRVRVRRAKVTTAEFRVMRKAWKVGDDLRVFEVPTGKFKTKIGRKEYVTKVAPEISITEAESRALLLRGLTYRKGKKVADTKIRIAEYMKEPDLAVGRVEAFIPRKKGMPKRITYTYETFVGKQKPQLIGIFPEIKVGFSDLVKPHVVKVGKLKPHIEWRELYGEKTGVFYTKSPRFKGFGEMIRTVSQRSKVSLEEYWKGIGVYEGIRAPLSMKKLMADIRGKIPRRKVKISLKKKKPTEDYFAFTRRLAKEEKKKQQKLMQDIKKAVVAKVEDVKVDYGLKRVRYEPREYQRTITAQAVRFKDIKIDIGKLLEKEQIRSLTELGEFAKGEAKRAYMRDITALTKDITRKAIAVTSTAYLLKTKPLTRVKPLTLERVKPVSMQEIKALTLEAVRPIDLVKITPVTLEKVKPMTLARMKPPTLPKLPPIAVTPVGMGVPIVPFIPILPRLPTGYPRRKRREALKRKVSDLFYTPSFTAKALGLTKVIKQESLKKFIRTAWTGLEVRPQLIVLPKKRKKVVKKRRRRKT